MPVGLYRTDCGAAKQTDGQTDVQGRLASEKHERAGERCAGTVCLLAHEPDRIERSRDGRMLRAEAGGIG